MREIDIFYKWIKTLSKCPVFCASWRTFSSDPKRKNIEGDQGLPAESPADSSANFDERNILLLWKIPAFCLRSGNKSRTVALRGGQGEYVFSLFLSPSISNKIKTPVYCVFSLCNYKISF